MSSRSKTLTWALPIVGLTALVAGTGMVVQNRPVSPEEVPPREPPTSPSVSNTGVSSNASSYIGAVGTSEPAGEPIAIAAHTSGVVESVSVNVGDTITAGKPLFIVDTTRARTEVALKQTEVTVAEQDLASLRSMIPPLRAALTSAEASVESAAADRRAAEADLADKQNQQRIAESVSDPRAISTEEVDRRRFAAQQAEARVSTASARIAEATARVAEADAELSRLVNPDSSDGPEILAAVARVERARRELEKAQADLDLLTVKAPADTRVLQVNIRPGEFAPASVPTEGLVVLGRTGPSHLRVEIDEVDIPRFDPNARAWASPRGDASNRVDLTLAYVEPLVVPKRTLSGRTSELIDTRVLQAVYTLDDTFRSPGIGQQFDVYIEAEPAR